MFDNWADFQTSLLFFYPVEVILHFTFSNKINIFLVKEGGKRLSLLKFLSGLFLWFPDCLILPCNISAQVRERCHLHSVILYFISGTPLAQRSLAITVVVGCSWDFIPILSTSQILLFILQNMVVFWHRF